MSTRCQVQVQSGENKNVVVLYHHSDGYPSNMIPLIYDAFEARKAQKYDPWQWGRSGKAASIICSVDPAGFDIEPGVNLHGDIEYLYVVTVTDLGKKGPKWKVKVFEVNIPWAMTGTYTYTDFKRSPEVLKKIMDAPISSLNKKILAAEL